MSEKQKKRDNKKSLGLELILKEDKHRKLYIKLVMLVFVSILATYLVFMVALIILSATGTIQLSNTWQWSPAVLIIVLMLGSLILGFVITLFAARKFLKPINALSQATKRVARGDFNVQIEPSKSSDEMSELIENFNRMVKNLANIETLKQDFVANVSHEFKTPLATIQGYSTLLQDETLSAEERKTYTKYIIIATKQLSSLTTNILKLSKIENNAESFEKKKYDCAEQIRQAILFLETQWTEKNIDLDINITNAEIFANEELLMQVWLNIIGNAIKFSSYGSPIRINTMTRNGKFLFSVKDHGCGMDETTKRRIFDKFYQGDNSHSKEGNGLGLSLVKKIIDISGGEIYIKSAKGEGTEFLVVLPLAQKDNQ